MQPPIAHAIKIPNTIKKIIDGLDGVSFNRAHFKKFNDSSLDYEVVYNVDSGDYMTYMDKQQDINLAIKSAFDKDGIEMAFPTQTIYVNKAQFL